MKPYFHSVPGIIYRLPLFSLFLTCFYLLNTNAQKNELDVIKDNWLLYSDAANSLYHHLTGEAYVMLAERSKEIAAINTLSGWQKKQEEIRRTLNEVVGPFPPKTPLNAKITRTVIKDDYRIEHIVYESQPGYYVTSSMFIPSGMKKNSRVPAIIYCSGHSAEGYRSPAYQQVIINLVKKNFVVFAFDPVGQGERLEYFDREKGKSMFNGPTTEHSYPGAQLFVTGASMARYMIWDGIRAVDYLLTRKEIDPARIGITGRSGGGTQSAYISAMDDRIAAAAPECYITNFTRLLQSIGPQDAEQNFFNGIYRGLDHPDFFLVRAPKPAMMITTTRDMFSIQGVRETEKEVARIYKAYGKEDNFSRVEDDAPHASTKKNREAMYAFFQKHLNHPGSSTDLEITQLTADELKVTGTGVVSTSLGGETVHSLNLKEVQILQDKLLTARSAFPAYLTEVINSAKKLSGYRTPLAYTEPIFTGRFQKEGYITEKYYVKGEGDYVIPYLLMIPEKTNGKSLIYLNPSGKSAEAGPEGEMEWFVKNGFILLAPDLVGIGEMGPGNFRGDAYISGSSHNIWYASIQIGRSIAGVRTADVIRLAQILKNRDDVSEISGLARKNLAPVMLHAAAFDKDIKRIALVEPYSSYLSIVMNRFYNPAFIHDAVPGSLKAYDLPDLAASLAPRKLLISGATDGNGQKTDLQNIEKDFIIIRTAYKYFNAAEELTIAPWDSDKKPFDHYREWIK